ncbi:MAG: hypothetical protein IT324_22540 [Anaerolineae bacterium]|nr:hypothetical protein [Anaerolineae bacterium]
MRAIRPRLRVPPGGWRALRKESQTFKERSDVFSVAVVLSIALIACLCLASSALVWTAFGRFPPALQVIDDIRFNADYRRGSTFTAAALAGNGKLYLGTADNGIFAYRTDSGWQGLWQQYTRATSGLPSDNIQGLTVDSQRLWIASNGGLSVGNLSGSSWQSLIGVNGFAPLGKDTKPKYARLSPDSHWLAVATDQGVGLYNTAAHDWQTLTQVTRFLPDDRVSLLAFDPMGSLWIGTQAGLVSLRPGDSASHVELPDQTVVDIAFGMNQITALTASGRVLSRDAIRAGNTWIANSQWKTLVGENGFKANARLPQDIAQAVLTDKAIWVVTRTCAVGRYDLATHDWQSYPPLSTKAKEARDLIVTGEDVYVATDAGLFHLLNSSVDTLTTVPVRKLALEGSQVWFLGDDAQVGVVDRQTKVVRAGGRFGPQNGPALLSDVATYKAFPSELWLAIPNVGVGAYNLETHAWRSVSSGLPANTAPRQLMTVNGLPAGLVMEGNTAALYLYRNQRWQRISPAGQTITATAQTERGLWYQVANTTLYFTDGLGSPTAYFENAAPPAQSTAAATLDNFIWTVQSNNLWRYDLGLHRWDKFPQADPINQLVVVNDTLLALRKNGQLATIKSDGTPDQVIFGAPNPQKPASFTSAAVYKGTLWLAGGQAYQYDRAAHTLIDSGVGPVDRLYTTAGALWALGDLVYRYDESARKWQPISGLVGAPKLAVPFNNVLIVLTDQNTLAAISEDGAVTAQGSGTFAGLADVTAVAQTEKGEVWFGSDQHGVGLYNSDLHRWIVDESVSGARAIIQLPDRMLVASSAGVVDYALTGEDKQKEFDGDARALVRVQDRGWLLAMEKDGYTLYRRDGPGKWTPIRKPNAAPIDVNTITSVVRSGNRLIAGTNNGHVVEYNVASGTWRAIRDSLPITRIDWMGVSGDANNLSIWLTGPAQNNIRRLIQIDARGQVTVRSASDHDVTSASVGGDRVWYTETSGGVYFVQEGTTPSPLMGVIAPTLTAIPTFTPTSPVTPTTRPTSSMTLVPSATSSPTHTPPPSLTPTLTLGQQLITEPVQRLTTNADQLWLATARAIYQLRWDGRRFEPQSRTTIAHTVKQLRADDRGLQIAFDDGSAARLVNGTLTPLDQFDTGLLYADSLWTWRRANNAVSVTLMGNPLPFDNGRFGYDDIQSIAANGADLWLGGKGSAIRLDENGAIVLYTPLPGMVQGLRYVQNMLLANLGTAVKRFDDKTKMWVDAAPNDYAAPVTVAKTGPIQWQLTDKGVSPDQPNVIDNGRFLFDVATALATSSDQLVIQTPMGVWLSTAPPAWGTFRGDVNAFKEAFTGQTTTQLNTGSDDPWQWTVYTDRATGQQALTITLRSDPAVTRKVDPAGAFADDVALSIADDVSDSQTLWVGTKGGLWKITADNGQFQQTALYAAGSAVSDLRSIAAGLLARVGTKAQLLKGNSFADSPADAANQRRVIARSGAVGVLLEQSGAGFSLVGLVDTPRRGFWFDQITAVAGLQDQLWTVTPRGLLLYRITTDGLVASRFDAWDKLGIPGVSQLQTAPLDPAKPDVQTVWALDTSGKTALALTKTNNQWTPMPLENSPFAAKKDVRLNLPGAIRWLRDGDTVRATLNGRALAWSNGRFDFDDVRDVAALPGSVWLATAGGPTLLQGNAPCKMPTEGLPSLDLKRIGTGKDNQLMVRDAANHDSGLDCAAGAWKSVSSDVGNAVFAPKQVTLDRGGWVTKPGSGKPLAITGLNDAQVFSGNRFSVDVVRDLTAASDTLWLATAGSALQVDAQGSTALVLDGLTQVDSRAIRAEDGGIIRLSAGGKTYRLNGEHWTTETGSVAPVTDAQSLTFNQGQWSAAPLPDPSVPLVLVKDAPLNYAVFAPSGKFSFDDVRDVTNDGASIWLATAGGIAQVALNGSNARITQLITTNLCGIPDAVRVEQNKLFVGYKGRTTGQFLNDSCANMIPWQHPQAITWPDNQATITLNLAGSTLTGERDGAQLFKLSQTERIAGLIGTAVSIDTAKLIAVIDDNAQTWLVFENGLAVLRKDVLRRRGS